MPAANERSAEPPEVTTPAQAQASPSACVSIHQRVGRAAEASWRVVRGEPDDVELAALCVVLAAVARGAAADSAGEGFVSDDAAWRLGAPGRQGVGAWLRATLPR